MAPDPRVSVIIRAKNEANDIGRTLTILAGQTIASAAEIVVVDSGSEDATVAIAREAGARVVEMAAEDFTFGRSLNLGCAEARGELLIALSAHAFPFDDRWLERMAATFDDPAVACACGYQGGPEREELHGPRAQDIADARRYPLWGYSNASGGFRAELWRQRPFREDMPGTEDKEWAWHWLERGYTVVVDPELAVDHDHFHEGVRPTYVRSFREWEGLAMFLDLPPYGPRDLASEWWSERDGRRNALRARLSHRRASLLVGGYRGRRSGMRRPAPEPRRAITPAPGATALGRK